MADPGFSWGAALPGRSLRRLGAWAPYAPPGSTSVCMSYDLSCSVIISMLRVYTIFNFDKYFTEKLSYKLTHK